MLDIVAKAAVIAALVFAVVVIVLLARSPPNSETPQQQYIADAGQNDEKNGKTKNDNIFTKFFTGVVWFIRLLDRHNGFISAISTLFVAIFTFVLVIATIALFNASEKAANAAKESADALIIVERPYIFMTTPKIVSGPNNSYRLEYELINYGRTPAILRFYIGQTYIKDDPNRPTNKVIWNGWEALRPGESHQGKLFEIRQKLEPDKSPLFWIEISYADMFNYMHTSGFTFFYMEVGGKGEFVAIASEKYNYHRREKLGNGEWRPTAGKPPTD